MITLEQYLYQYFEQMRTSLRGQPLLLGGVTGSGGGIGGPPGGFIGYLTQTRVAYDLSEASSNLTPISGASLLDNLNHIRNRITVLETISGIDSINISLSGLTTYSGITTIDFSGNIGVTQSGNTAFVFIPSGVSPSISGYLKADGTIPLTADWDSGNQIISTKGIKVDYPTINNDSTNHIVLFGSTVDYPYDYDITPKIVIKDPINDAVSTTNVSITNPGFTGSLTGWTVTGGGTGWYYYYNFAKHDAGNIDELTQNLTFTAGTVKCIISFSMYGGTAGNLTAYLDTNKGDTLSYNNSGGYETYLSFTATTTMTLRIVPSIDYDGYIDNVSIKILSDISANPVIIFENYSTTTKISEMRFANSNVYIGDHAGENHSTGTNNVGIGNFALYYHYKGNSNVAVGQSALNSNRLGSNNVAIGTQALYSNIRGKNNIAIGSTAGYSETGDNKLYIDISTTSTPLIYGEFDTKLIKINGALQTSDNKITLAGNSLGLTGGNFSIDPTGQSTGDILTYSGTSWIAYDLGLGTNIGVTNSGILFGNINSGSYTNIDKIDGTITLLGNATVFEDIKVNILNAKTGITAPTDEVGFRGNANFYARNFVHTQADEVQFDIEIPHNWKKGGLLYPHVHFSPWITGSGTSKFNLEYYWTNIDNSFPASTSAYSMTKTWGTDQQWYHLVASGVTPMTSSGMEMSSILKCRLYRDNSIDGNFPGKVTILYFDLHYEIDSLGSREEYNK